MTYLEKLDQCNWQTISSALDDRGYALSERIFSSAECAQLAALYERHDRFRATVAMRRHGFGSGEYKYFSYPLPEVVATLRRYLYAQLAPIANVWEQRLRSGRQWPAGHCQLLGPVDTH